MKLSLRKINRIPWVARIARGISNFIIDRLADGMGMDAIQLFYQRMGILNYQDDEASGERYLLHEYLKRTFSAAPVIFDVGANTGNYTQKVKSVFPRAALYAFEPNPAAFDVLAEKQAKLGFGALRVALGEADGTLKLYTYAAADLPSEHASVYKNVMQDLHGSAALAEIETRATTLDHFCDLEGIAQIDFLKIDTEGHELAVLKGAAGLLGRHKVGCIQFEFNEMNIISRVFLKDFYDLLPGFRFYRLAPRGLIPLGKYNSKNEIFQFQNILAVDEAFQRPPNQAS